MTRARIAATVAIAFLVSQILAIAVHGFILAGDYGPFYGTLLRDQQEASWRMLLLPLSHLAFISALVWVFMRARLEGSLAAQGIQLGLLGWVMGQVPLWLLWYAEQPWPGNLVVKQLVLELISSLVIGVTIARAGGQFVRRA
jgi:hypothetical protein